MLFLDMSSVEIFESRKYSLLNIGYKPGNDRRLSYEKNTSNRNSSTHNITSLNNVTLQHSRGSCFSLHRSTACKCSSGFVSIYRNAGHRRAKPHPDKQ